MSFAGDFTQCTGESSNEGIGAGCGGPPTLLGAATVVSVGISTVLQHMNGIKDSVAASSRSTLEACASSMEMKRNATSKVQKSSELDDEKKKGMGWNSVQLALCSPSEEANVTRTETTTAVFAPHGILHHSSEGVHPSTLTRSKSNKVVRISPPREETTKMNQIPMASRSPVARMRHQSSDSSSANPPPHEGQRSPSRSPKSMEEVKSEKQRKWRSKLKQAQEQKRLEKQSLSSDYSSRRCSSGKGSPGFAVSVGDHVLDLIAHCGDVEPDVSDSDGSRYESSSSSEGTPHRKSRRRSKKSNHHHYGRDRLNEDDGRGILYEEESNVREDHHRLRVPERRTRNDDGLEEKSRTRQASTHSQQQETDHPTLQYTSRPDLETSNAYRHPRRRQSPNPRRSDFTRDSTSISESKIDETEYVKAFVHDMITDGCPFFWQKEMMVMSSKEVVLKLKPGRQTPEGAFCGPRMTWQLDEFETYGINVFDIQTMDRATPLQLKHYPFAVPSRTLCVRMNRGQEFYFEAPSNDEAFSFLYGMKLIVARLSLSLVVGNMDELLELLDLNSPDDMTIKTKARKSLRITAIDDLAQDLLHHTFSSGRPNTAPSPKRNNSTH